MPKEGRHNRHIRRWGVAPPVERTYGLEIWWRLLGKVACLEWDDANPPGETLLRLVGTGGIKKRDAASKNAMRFKGISFINNAQTASTIKSQSL